MTREAAIAQILVVRDQIYQMGNNDFEIPEVNEILAELEAGRGDPDKDLVTVNQILSMKVDR